MIVKIHNLLATKRPQPRTLDVANILRADAVLPERDRLAQADAAQPGFPNRMHIRGRDALLPQFDRLPNADVREPSILDSAQEIAIHTVVVQVYNVARRNLRPAGLCQLAEKVRVNSFGPQHNDVVHLEVAVSRSYQRCQKRVTGRGLRRWS